MVTTEVGVFWGDDVTAMYAQDINFLPILHQPSAVAIPKEDNLSIPDKDDPSQCVHYYIPSTIYLYLDDDPL